MRDTAILPNIWLLVKTLYMRKRSKMLRAKSLLKFHTGTDIGNTMSE